MNPLHRYILEQAVKEEDEGRLVLFDGNVDLVLLDDNRTIVERKDFDSLVRQGLLSQDSEYSYLITERGRRILNC